MAAILFLGGIGDTAKLFCWGAIVCSIIEYITSWAMEKLFHARWWDYPDRFLNLNGRICVPATLLFGFFTTLVVSVIQPALTALLSALDTRVLEGCCGAFLALLALDLLVTNMGLSGFRRKIDAYCDALTAQAQTIYGVLTEGDNPVAESYQRLKNSPVGHAYVRLRELMPGPVAIEDIGHDLAVSFSAALTAQERRVMDAFPRMRVNSPSISDLRDKLLGPHQN